MPKGIYNRNAETPKRRRRRTVAAPVATATSTTPIPTVAGRLSFNSLAEFISAAKELIPALNMMPTIPAPVAAPAGPAAAPVVVPRKVYSFVKNPVPPFEEGTTQITVWKWLQAHSSGSQQELEAGTGLTEGQIKGAIRQLRLMGYVQTSDAKNGD
jgi:hypothetical protein